MTPYLENLDEVLRRADPLGGAMLETLSIETALDELGQQLVEEPVPVTRAWTRAKKRRLTRPIIGAGVASLLVVSVAGAASLLTARTGQSLPAKYVQASGPGQLLRIWAPNFCRVALAESSDIKYPPDYENWRLNVLTFEQGIRNPSATGACPVTPPGGAPFGGQEEVTTGAERAVFAMGAFCAWVSDFKSAKQSANSSGTSTASREVAGATAWPAVRAVDPHPGKDTVFGFILPFQHAVAAGSATQVAKMLTNPEDGCAGFVPTPLDRGVTTPGTPVKK